ncbi:MAG: PEP-CTERM sorting domain-containing protein [Fimbriimonadales bacterium]|nr:PEP-CTERM sorting domain-containing protein [Fimbriimonadales bacterium]
MLQRIAVACACAVLALGAYAQWNETGDAPEAPSAQFTGPFSNPLTTIMGSLNPGGGDYGDAYFIYIADPLGFSATTVGGATWDTQLFLFKADGLGVLHNDDSPAGTLQSYMGYAYPVNPGGNPWNVWAPANLPVGTYIIQVTQYNRDPVNAGNALIWNSSPFNQQRTPDGPGAPGPVASWTGTPTGASTYTISFTGVHSVPEPGTLLALGAGVALLLARRRK